MWVVNNNKEHVKMYLRSDIESNISNLIDASNRIHETIAAINRATSGTATGIDQQMIGDCQRALQELSSALQNLYVCRNYVHQIDTREWIDDEQYGRNHR